MTAVGFRIQILKISLKNLEVEFVLETNRLSNNATFNYENDTSMVFPLMNRIQSSMCQRPATISTLHKFLEKITINLSQKTVISRKMTFLKTIMTSQ